MRPRRSRPVPVVPRSAFVGFRFPPEIIVLALRWYLRYGLSYRDVEELLAERGIEVDHVTIYRWVQRFTPLLADAAGPCRRAVGDRWFVDETYVKVAGQWRYVYRAVDQSGQIIDVYVSARRDFRAARRFFASVLRAHGEPTEVVTDRAPALRAAIEGLMPVAFHNKEQYANNRIECDHGRLKARLRPMRGLKRDHTTRVIIRGHAFVQNIRRGHYELGTDTRPHRRIESAFIALARTLTEHPPWPLRNRCRRAPPPACRDRVHRTRPYDLNPKRDGNPVLRGLIRINATVPFTQVEAGNGVMLDFADTNADPSGMHLAFLVTERDFDEIFDRITERAMPYWADPRRNEPDQINHHDGGRGVYFGDPHTNVGWEIITRPYGSAPTGEQTDIHEAARVPAEVERGDEEYE